MAATAQINYGWLFCKKNCIGCMRVMACGTVSAVDRLMLGNRFHLALDGIGMTLAAQRDHGFLQKPFFFCGMGIMAIQAPLFAQQRLMYPVFTERVVIHITV